MEISEFASTIITLLGPVILEEGVKFGFTQLKPLYKLIRKKLTGEDDKEILRKIRLIEVDPDLEKRKAALVKLLQEELETDPEFASELVDSMQATLRDPETVDELTKLLGSARIQQLLSSYGPQVLEQLPLRIANFTGREIELDKLVTGLSQPAGEDDPVKLWVVVGMGGIGKSTLAIEAAHRAKQLFPDGQLYVNLRGPENQPLEPIEVLAGFLRDLGTADQFIPSKLEERGRMFRTKLANLRILLFLDNACSTSQIEHLLPANPNCVVLVTCRSPLPDLDNAARINLDVLPADDAHLLLEKLVNHRRVNLEPEAAELIVSTCGFLPLAIRIAGGNLSVRQHWSLKDYAKHLELKRLELGGLSVQASFDISYQDLKEQAAILFRYASLLPGDDFSAYLAAGLLKVDDFDARDLVDYLVEMQLLQWNWGTRYQYHDLVREYAREKVASDTKEAYIRFRKRIVNWYLDSVRIRNYELQDYLHPQAADILIVSETESCLSSDDDPCRALEWFEVERMNLLGVLDWAVELEEWSTASQLARGLVSFLNIRGYWRDWEEVQNIALSAAQHLGDLKSEADALTGLGSIYRLQGKSKEAEPLLLTALDIRREIHDQAGEAYTLMELGLVRQRQGQREEAGSLLENSLAIYRQLDDKAGESMLLNQLGNLRRLEAKWDKAAELFLESLKITEQNQDLIGKAISLNLLANVYRLQGKWETAIEKFKESQEINQKLGNKYGEAIALGGLGNIYRGQGRWKLAVEMYQHSLQIADQVGDLRGRSITLTNLGRVLLKMGNLKVAMQVLTESQSLSEQLELIRGKSISLRVMGEVYAKQGDLDRGVNTILESLEIAENLGDQRCTAQSWNSLGIVYTDYPEHWEKAASAFENALAIRQQKDDSQGQGQTLMNVGVLYHHQGETEQAVQMWNKALDCLDKSSYDYRQVIKYLKGVATASR